MNRLKDIPALQRDGSNLAAVMQAVQEVMQTFRGYRGDKLDKALTLRDLSLAAQRGITGGGSIDVGIVGGSTPGAPVTGAYVVDPTPPPTPEGLDVGAGISSLFVSCSQPVYPQGHGHAVTVVYGAKWPADDLTQPTFSEAVELFRYQGTFSAYATDPATRWCIWIKWQSVDGVMSTDPAGGTNGIAVTTGQDVALLVEAMTGPGNPFTIVTEETIIDGVTFPEGTYSTKAFIQDLQVTTAKVKELDLDNARVSKMSVSKLTAGTIDTGDINSTHMTEIGGIAYPSFTINASTGLATFNNAVVRGTVYANAGMIGGNTIDSTSIHSSVAGYDTGQGFYLGSDGKVFFGNETGNKITWDGTNLGITSPQLTLTNGSAVFSGELAAQSGYFSGSLYGANITGATGEFSGTLRAGVLDLQSASGLSTPYYAGTHTITVPTKRVKLRVTLVGGGGGGASNTSMNSKPYGGGGGGGGGRRSSTYTFVAGETLTLVVGAGGAGGGSGTPKPGVTGGATTITKSGVQLLSASGGAGGSGTAGGAGGAGDPVGTNGAGNASESAGGAGGSATGYGVGGSGGARYSSGANGTGYGAGGGGSGAGDSYSTTTPGAGGSGSAGYAIIEFIDPNSVVLRGEYTGLTAALQRQGIAII